MQTNCAPPTRRRSVFMAEGRGRESRARFIAAEGALTRADGYTWELLCCSAAPLSYVRQKSYYAFGHSFGSRIY